MPARACPPIVTFVFEIRSCRPAGLDDPMANDPDLGIVGTDEEGGRVNLVIWNLPLAPIRISDRSGT
jgi:hypothetical protein